MDGAGFRNGLIINADDLGISPEVNLGIFRGIDAGIITDVSLMVKRSCSREAAQELKQRGITTAGVHIDLDTELGWSSPGKETHPRQSLIKLLSEQRLKYTLHNEIRDQIETFLHLGLSPSHIDTHHHVHGFFPIFHIMASLAGEYHIPAMRFSTAGYRLPGRQDIVPEPHTIEEMRNILTSSGIDFCDAMYEGAHTITQILKTPAELIVHPGIHAEAWRNEELDVLLSAEFQNAVSEQALQLQSFADMFSNNHTV